MDRGADGHTVPGCCGGVPRSEFGLEYASTYARLPLLRWRANSSPAQAES
jgi:hypothetical protein